MSKILKVLALGVALFFVAGVVAAASSSKGKGGGKALAPLSEWVEETFIDYGPGADTHAGPGPHPTTESESFHLVQGGIRWFAGGDVKYKITGAQAVAGGNAAIEAAEATTDGFVTARTFTRDDGSPSANLCGGVNEVVWGAIDGAGGALATASVCRNVATKEIGGFRITLDTAESWIIGSVAGSFDVENAATHEWVHVAGLGHVNAPKDGCLTMYRFAQDGETQKRTPGLGDKLGLDALYATGDTTAGPGCGL